MLESISCQVKKLNKTTRNLQNIYTKNEYNKYSILNLYAVEVRARDIYQLNLSVPH